MRSRNVALQHVYRRQDKANHRQTRRAPHQSKIPSDIQRRLHFQSFVKAGNRQDRVTDPEGVVTEEELWPGLCNMLHKISSITFTIKKAEFRILSGRRYSAVEGHGKLIWSRGLEYYVLDSILLEPLETSDKAKKKHMFSILQLLGTLMVEPIRGTTILVFEEIYGLDSALTTAWLPSWCWSI